jgi:hypothetical protein
VLNGSSHRAAPRRTGTGILSVTGVAADSLTCRIERVVRTHAYALINMLTPWVVMLAPESLRSVGDGVGPPCGPCGPTANNGSRRPAGCAVH